MPSGPLWDSMGCCAERETSRQRDVPHTVGLRWDCDGMSGNGEWDGLIGTRFAWDEPWDDLGLESGMTWDGAGITWGWCWDETPVTWHKGPEAQTCVATGWQICQPTGPCPPCNAALAQRLIHLSSFLRLSRALDHAARAGWVCTAAKVRSVVSLIFPCCSNKESGGALWPASDSSSTASFAASAAFIASICVAWHLIVSFTADTEGSGQIPCTLT